jgi:hypothetical protein
MQRASMAASDRISRQYGKRRLNQFEVALSHVCSSGTFKGYLALSHSVTLSHTVIMIGLRDFDHISRQE